MCDMLVHLPGVEAPAKRAFIPEPGVSFSLPGSRTHCLVIRSGSALLALRRIVTTRSKLKETLSPRVPDCDISSVGRFGLPGDESDDRRGCKSLSFRRRVIRGSFSIRSCRHCRRGTPSHSRGAR